MNLTKWQRDAGEPFETLTVESYAFIQKKELGLCILKWKGAFDLFPSGKIKEKVMNRNGWCDPLY